MEDVVDKSYDSLEEIRVDLDMYSEKYKFTEGNFDLNVTINDISRIGNLPDNNIPNSSAIYSICDKELLYIYNNPSKFKYKIPNTKNVIIYEIKIRNLIDVPRNYNSGITYT